MNRACPCGSGYDYMHCCGRFLEKNDTAETAEMLMRSRYTAYVTGSEDYLLKTWHPDRRPGSLELERHPVTWKGLEIIHVSAGKVKDKKGKVEFVARFEEEGRKGCLHEKSRFVRENGCWYYLDGLQVSDDVVQVSRNALCPCGSGKKYKRCCGQS